MFEPSDRRATAKTPTTEPDPLGLVPDRRRGILAELSEPGPPRGCMVALAALTGVAAAMLIVDVEVGVSSAQGLLWRDGQRWTWQIAVVLACFSCLALVFRLGWLVPCTVIGVFLGCFVCPPPIGSGTAVSKMQDTISGIWQGTAFGVVVGLAIDLLPRLFGTVPDDTPRCTGCGYDLRGSVDRPECPECGEPIPQQPEPDP